MKIKKMQVGETVEIELKGGKKAEVMAVKEDGENMIFCFSNCLDEIYRMNESRTNKGGWQESELRKKLNGEILEQFPEALRAKMIPFENGDLLRIPTEKEIFGVNEYGEEENGVEQWEPMKKRRNRTAYRGENEEIEWYWLQNVVSSAYFAYVSGNGDANFYDASDAHGVRPAFGITA